MLALIRAEQIVTTELVNNPGILPFRLGSVKFQKTEHVFLHYYELDKIKDSINNIESYLGIYLEYVRSSDQAYFSDTLLVTNQVLVSMLETIYNKFNSLIKQSNQKRGLINGLGSIIKGISGNLDQDDALFYNKAINILQSNQQALTDKLNSGISLNKQLLQTFNVTLSTLVSNEYKIHAKLNDVMSTVNMSNYRLSDFVKINGLFNLIKINLQNILNYVTSLENALSFSKLSITHHSVISSENIRSMLDVLLKLYDKSELMIDEYTEIRDFYDIIVCGSYYVDNKIVFILKFPILHSNIYTYYHLFPTPTVNNTILIPPKPYLAMNDDDHRYMDKECKRFHKVYYCQEGELTTNTNPNDCIYQLMLKQEIISSCSFVQFKAESEILQKLDDYHYILSCTKITKVQLHCDRDAYQSLQGTYLIEVPEGCNFSTHLHHIRNNRNKLRGTAIKLLSFHVSNITIKNKDHPLLLENVSLDEMHKLENLVEKENYLELDKYQDNSYHFWTAPIYILMILAVIIFAVYQWLKTKRTNPAVTEQAELRSGGAQLFFSGEERASN